MVLYTFDEGGGNTIHDVSGTGVPLNLTIPDPKAIAWNANGSLNIKAATLIASSTAATKVSNALKASNAVTIEAWVQPSNTTQAGPARILTLSKDTYNRNLTLGQGTTHYNVRLRTSKTDKNGNPGVSTAGGALNTSLTHVVYTRAADGTVTLYLNGVQQLKTATGGNFSNWDGTYRLALGGELNGTYPWLGTFYRLAIYANAFSATEVSKAYAAGSNAPVNTVTTTTTATTVDTVPVAVNDSASSTGTAVTISPLANDSGLANTPVTVSVVSAPAHGTASVQTGNKIVYTPASGFAGSDSFAYRVADADGDMATATVSIGVTCSTCASVSSKSLNLFWNPNADAILGYYVYYGATATTATTFAGTVQGPLTSFTTLASDLNLQTGAQVCFRVKAYNTVGVSAYSSAACGTI